MTLSVMSYSNQAPNFAAAKVAYYAMGAGLGHLSRALKICDKLAIESATIITGSHFLTEPTSHYAPLANAMSAHQLINPPKSFKNKAEQLHWLITLLGLHQIEYLIIDCFPVGIAGELNGLTQELSQQLPQLKLVNIERLIKWPNYNDFIELDNKFDITYVVEPLTPEHHTYLVNHSLTIKQLSLSSAYVAGAVNQQLAKEIPAHYCAVIHSGKSQEIELLVQYASARLRLKSIDLPILLIAPKLPQSLATKDNLLHINVYPAIDYLTRAKIIVSAGGFNILNETSKLDIEHWILPFDRRFDDQYLRAARYRRFKTADSAS